MYTNIGSIEYTDVFSVKSLTRQLISSFPMQNLFSAIWKSKSPKCCWGASMETSLYTAYALFSPCYVDGSWLITSSLGVVSLWNAGINSSICSNCSVRSLITPRIMLFNFSLGYFLEQKKKKEKNLKRESKVQKRLCFCVTSFTLES